MAFTGTLTIEHNLGIRPRNLNVWVGKNSGIIRDGKDVPEPGSEILMPPLTYDPAQGQYYGYQVVRLDARFVSIHHAYYLAFNALLNEWYVSSDDYTIRIELIP